MAKKRKTDAILVRLRERGLRYPGAHLKSPWPGHLDLAVKDKTFAYLSVEGEPFTIGCKLPRSCSVALMLPFCKPTAYGLGKSGWVSAAFAEQDDLPIEMLEAWLDESYRAQAPKKLVAQLDAATGTPPGREVSAARARASAVGEKASAPRRKAPARGGKNSGAAKKASRSRA